MNLSNNKITAPVIFIIFLSFTTSCFTGYYTNQNNTANQYLINFANLYNPKATTIFPNFVPYNENDSTTLIYTYLYLPQLNYLNINGSQQAKILLNIKVTPSILNRTPIDTLNKIFVIKKNKYQKNLIFPIRIHTPTDTTSLINIYIKDIYARKANIALIPIDKTTKNRSSYFLVRYADDLKPVFGTAIYKDFQYLIEHSSNPDSIYIFHYKTDTTIPNPPYYLSNRIPKIFADTVYKIKTDSNITFYNTGIYLFSLSSNDQNGKFMVYYGDNFPLIKKASQMIPPLKYITTYNEYKKIRNNVSPKMTVDSFWLSIARQPAQARQLIKNYYNRVLLANIYFSSYKEGWKTDRGMLYIIFGAPQIVHILDNSEIWYYYDTQNNIYIKFKFVKHKVKFTYDYFLKPNANYRYYWKQAVKQWRSGIIPNF